MDKPDWKDAPEWAMWLAQDKDGDWYWWQDQPVALRYPFWMPSGTDSTGKIKRARPGRTETVIVEWATKLEPRS